MNPKAGLPNAMGKSQSVMHKRLTVRRLSHLNVESSIGQQQSMHSADFSNEGYPFDGVNEALKEALEASKAQQNT